MPLQIPPGLEAQRRLGPDWATWLDTLPRLAEELVDDWALTLDGTSLHGYCSLVLPVRTAGGGPAMLKVGFVDDETEHEHLALQRWGGHGAVKLLSADPHRGAMLLERLHREDLTELWDIEACEIVAGLYASIHVPACHSSARSRRTSNAGPAPCSRCTATHRSRGGSSSRQRPWRATSSPTTPAPGP